MNLYKYFADNLLANMYDADASVEIHAERLRGGSKEEIFQNFLHYRNAVREMFVNISKIAKDTPISVSDFTVYIEKQEDRDARDSVVIPLRCVFAVLYIIGSCGAMRDGCIAVNKKTFRQHFVKIRKEHIQQALSMLTDNGFFFDCDVFSKGDEFEVTYPDNHAVLCGLASFANTLNQSRSTGWEFFVAACTDYGDFRSFILMNTHLYKWSKSEPKPFELYDLLRFLDKNEDIKAVEVFHNKMISQGYYGDLTINTFLGKGASILYRKGEKDIYALLYAKQEERRAYIGIKMRTLNKHTDYIRQCSDVFKDGFTNLWKDCSIDRCPYGIEDMENCECRVRYTNRNKAYDKCTNTFWEYIWDRTVFQMNENDIDSYLFFINQKYKVSEREKAPHVMPENKVSPFDREKFTRESFRPHFEKNVAVIAVCGTTDGFMDVQRDFMHEALFRSKIHPKTKASRLSDEEIEILYDKILEVADEIRANKIINKTVCASAAGKPCPVCGTLIEKGSAFGSTFYICPRCQKEK